MEDSKLLKWQLKSPLLIIYRINKMDHHRYHFADSAYGQKGCLILFLSNSFLITMYSQTSCIFQQVKSA